MPMRDDWLPPAQERQVINICREFIKANRITCEDACVTDSVYEHAPDLVHSLAQIIGYYQEPDDQ